MLYRYNRLLTIPNNNGKNNAKTPSFLIMGKALRFDPAILNFLKKNN